MMSIIKEIQNSGIVGCGGAGFPAHVKLNGKFTYVIVNGAECEPLLHTDRYLMQYKSKELILALTKVGKFVEAKQVVIALKGEYRNEIMALEKAIAELHSDVKIHRMEAYYPTGDEHVVVNEVTKLVVPPAGIPKDVDVVVSNVGTMVGIYDAMEQKPFTHKYLTVAGEVAHPTILQVPIGTPILDCIAAAGGATVDGYYVVNGGPMMGKIIDPEEVTNSYVTKTTSGLIVLPKENPIIKRKQVPLTVILKRAKTACIQCNMCTDLCPRHMLGHPLQPHRIMRKMAYAKNVTEILEEYDVKQAMICSECGVCEVVACPMGLRPRAVNQYIKAKLQEAKFVYEKENKAYMANSMKVYRNIPSKRVAARVGVSKYYHNKVEDFVAFTPRKIYVLLQQHIGAPAKVVVTVGEQVKEGQVIAVCEEGKLGANLHSGLDGTVTVIDDKGITIERA